MSVDRKKLRGLAERATQGEWRPVRDDDPDGLIGWEIWAGFQVATLEELARDGDDLGRLRNDAHYIAAVSPNVVIELLDQVDAAALKYARMVTDDIDTALTEKGPNDG